MSCFGNARWPGMTIGAHPRRKYLCNIRILSGGRRSLLRGRFGPWTKCRTWRIEGHRRDVDAGKDRPVRARVGLLQFRGCIPGGFSGRNSGTAVRSGPRDFEPLVVGGKFDSRNPLPLLTCGCGLGSLLLRCRRIIEVHFRGFARTFRSREVGVVHFESRPAGIDVVRKLLDVSVVVLQGVVVTLALDGDAVLGAR